jgi:succinyl-diaminopimelate desuccinylase
MKNILADLVAMRTISDDIAANEQALDYIQSYLEERGMIGKRYVINGHGAYVASTRTDNLMNPKILLAAHVDVVPGSDAVFTLKHENGKVLGRGVYDMKSAAAAYLQVVDDIQDSLTDYDFGIMITTDEELGGKEGVNGTLGLIDAGHRAEICVLPDGGRNWQIERLAKGAWRFYLKAGGKSAHGSRPWQGDSAAYKLVDALYAIKQLFIGEGPETDTLNIGVIHGGTADNQIPDYMEAEIVIRILSEENLTEKRAAVAKICEQYGVYTEDRLVKHPFVTDTDLPLIQTFMQCVEQVTGNPSLPCISYAASDAPHFQTVGIPCIVTYPLGGMHHSEEEWIDESVLADFPNIIHAYLDKTAKQPATEPALEAVA